MKKRLFISFIVVTALLLMLSPVVAVAETEREISLNKSAEPLFFSEVGQEIKYEILIENTGNKDLDEVRVIDELLGIDKLVGSLASGEVEVITATYVITNEDMERKYVGNTASVTGKDPNFIGKGLAQVSAEDSIRIEADIDYQPAIRLRKEAAPSTYNEVGDVIDYTITVTNTGNAVLNNVTVVDDLLDLGSEADIGTLEIGAETTVNGSYTIVQADLDNGSVTNTADVSGKDLEGTVVEDSDVAEVVAEINPDISINKEAAPTTYSEVGDEITYTITVNNTGNVTLYDVVVTDPLLGLDTNIGTLDPGEEKTVNGSYAVVQADLDNGSISNTADVTGEDSQGTVVDDFDVAEVVAEINPDISINKEAAPTTYSAVGDEITYTITVNNTGNVTLYDVVITDPLLGLDTNIGTLDPGEEDMITETYTITQEDLSKTAVENTATVSGEDASGTKVEDFNSAQVNADISSEPSISITKEPNPETYSYEGQEIVYTITVTNIGNVALEDVTVVDDLLGLDTNIGTLNPGDYEVITESYFITSDDMERGYVYNLAAVTGKDASFIGKGSGQVSDEAEAEITLDFISEPDISITKMADPTTYDSVGDVIEYTITVTNTGNVTLDPVTVTDPMLDLDSDIGSLEPGQVYTLPVQTYTITQSDLDMGTVENTAAVEGEDPDEQLVTDSDDEVVTAVQNPDISITKMADPTTYDGVGDVIEYTITVTNTGNVTLYNVTVTDPMLDLDSNIGSLEPGQVYTLPVQTYTITQSDLDMGTVENTAAVEGKDRADVPVTDSDDEVVTAVYEPGDNETAWAYHEDYALAFNDLGISNRWGWFNGPLAPEGEYVFELWAGAGGNDLDKGTLVGEVTVSFVDKTVQYKVDNGYYIEEVHLYMGNEYPETANPGLLGFTGEDLNSQQYTIEFSYFEDVDFTEDIYVAAHAVVGGSW